MPPSALERLIFAAWRRLRRTPRVSPGPGLGGVSPLGSLPPPVGPPWAEASAFGEHLEAGLASGTLGRDGERHVWFYGLCRAAVEAGRPAWATRAQQALGEWLAAPPEARWQHPSDAAARVLAWAAGLSWLPTPLDPALAQLLCAAVAEHTAFTRAHLALRSDEADHRLVVQAAALVVAGCVWPTLDEAPGWRGEGLTLLGRALPDLVGADGAPLLSPPGGLLAALEAALLARAVARAAAAPVPLALDAAIVRGAWFLRALGEGGPPPEVGALPARGPLSWGPCPFESPTHAAVALGLDPGPAGPNAAVDGGAAWLAGRTVAPGPTLAPEQGWSALHFRRGGWAILHGQVRGLPSRVVLDAAVYGQPWAHADAGQVLWSVGDAELLVDPGHLEGQPDLGGAGAHSTPTLDGRALYARLDGVRVDGREASARATLEPPRGAGLRLGVERELRVGGARLVLDDRLVGSSTARYTLRLPLGPEVVLEAAGRGFTGRCGVHRLEVQVEGPLEWVLEPAPLAREGRRVSGPALVGRGGVRGGDRVRVKLELR